MQNNELLEMINQLDKQDFELSSDIKLLYDEIKNIEGSFDTSKIEKEIGTLKENISSIQLQKGDKGDKGEKGDKGDKGKDGKNGKDGKDGRNGIDGINGLNGKDGKDGSPDTPEQIVGKINTLENVIERKTIKGLDTVIDKPELDRAIDILDKRTQYLINKTVVQPNLSGYVPTTRTLTINGTAHDLSADRTWSVGTVTSVAALTLGTTGTDLSSTVATGTTTPVITLNVPTASATNRGALSSTDWTTFNNKFSLPAFTSGSVPFSDGTTLAQDNANLFWNKTTKSLGIGTTNTSFAGYDPKLVISGNGTGVNGRTTFIVKNNSADSASVFFLTNSNGKFVGVQASGPSYVIGEAGGIFTSNMNLYISTDGSIPNGGTSKIFFTTGGWSNNPTMTITPGNPGNVGMGGVSNPTARLHLSAGTATASTAPLKFTAGTNLTTPEAGVMEYDGTSLFFTPSSTRYNVLMNGLGLAGGQTIVGGTASGNNLTLSSTSNATKGKILFGTSAYDEVNNRLGIGISSPVVKLHVLTGTYIAPISDTNYVVQNSGQYVAEYIGTNGAYAGFLVRGTGAGTQPFVQYYNSSTGKVWTQMMTTAGDLNILKGNALGTTLLTLGNNLNVGIAKATPTARLHLGAGTATAGTAPLKLDTGTNLTTAEAGAIEYNNTFHVTNSDATRRHVVTAPNTTKVTASAPYTNDGYITINIGGTDFKVMTTA